MGYISMVILQKTNFYLNKIINNEESFTVILNRSLVNVKMSSNEVQFIKDALKALAPIGETFTVTLSFLVCNPVNGYTISPYQSA